MKRGERPPRRDPVPPPPDAPGGYLRLAQPSLIWREWRLYQEGTLLLEVERAGWRRFRVETAGGREEARFVDRRLVVGPVVARPAPGGAVVTAGSPPQATTGREEAQLRRRGAEGDDGARLSYRSEDTPYPALADQDGPLALVGDLRGAGFSAEARVWVANRLLARGSDGLRLLAITVLVLRERPGSFR